MGSLQFFAKRAEKYIFYFYNWSADNWALPTVNSLSLYLGWYEDLFNNYLKVPACYPILKKATKTWLRAGFQQREKVEANQATA